MRGDDGRVAIGFALNGRDVTVRAWPLARLLDVLREELRFCGTKEGCGEGECGACAVLLDGELVNACLLPMAQVAGRRVTTIEGVAADPARAPLLEVFAQHNAAQCGICTPGMILAAVALLDAHPEPSDAQIREHLAGNLCRCTGYTKIFSAVREAAQRLRAGAAADTRGAP